MKGLIDGDDLLRREMVRIISQRKALGLDGLVGGPQMMINQYGVFQDSELRVCVLKVTGSSSFRSADFLVSLGSRGENPFQEVNIAPKTVGLPDTRLEAFAFEIKDLEKYV